LDTIFPFCTLSNTLEYLKLKESNMDWSAYYGNLFKQLSIMFLPSLLKTGIYYFIFQKKGYSVTIIVCFLVAYIPQLAGIGIPIPLPSLINLLIGIGIGAAILNYYSKIEIFPTGLLIIGLTEAIFYFILKLII
jgi:hypothetical protein